jgi:hypothetical protein
MKINHPLVEATASLPPLAGIGDRGHKFNALSVHLPNEVTVPMPARPDAYRLFQQAQRLPLNDLEQLIASLAEEVELRKSAPSEVADDRAGWRQEFRKCGKSNCRCAESDYRHGPYWYRTIWVDGAAKKEYRRSRR